MTLPWAAPDYSGACLTGVMPSVMSTLLRAPARLPIPATDRVVVLLVDGLGHELLRLAETDAPFLCAMQPLLADGLDSPFPSTTATSLTSFGTGLTPGVHGLVGTSFWPPEKDDVLYPLGWWDRPNPFVVQPERTVLQDAAAAINEGMGKVAQPLRVAMTGTQVSPSIDHTVYLVGRDRALRRIDDAIMRAGA